ncbi:MAG: GNAT superfamily N-acetyltransferase, partial [Ilumatobacter sp.]
MSDFNDSSAAAAAAAAAADVETSVTIEVAIVVDDELVAAFASLIPQLSSSPAPDAEQLGLLVNGDDTVLFTARVDGTIVGSLTLAFYRIPTGLKSWIEDVVVDDAARGHGVGRKL